MNNTEDLLSAYFKGELKDDERLRVEQWVQESDENRKVFEQTKDLIGKIEFLQTMELFDYKSALNKVDSRVEKISGHTNNNLSSEFKLRWQRIAAILFWPVLLVSVLSMYFYYRDVVLLGNATAMQRFETTTGIRGEVTLPDGSIVKLNGGTVMEYPSRFMGKTREVKISGEAYFDVVKNSSQPFVVDLGSLKVRVLGTTFNTANYKDESSTEVVLESGSVEIIMNDKVKTKLVPGELLNFDQSTKRILVSRVNVDKYTAWKDNKLVFRDDKMSDVVLKLGRWFNVDVELVDKELEDYVYTATFEQENLQEVLNLLKISAPIEYEVLKREQSKDGTFAKQKIKIRKRKNQ